MEKTIAINLFGGVTRTARALGVAQPCVSRWSDTLPPRIVDRVIAALVREGRLQEAAQYGSRRARGKARKETRRAKQ